MTDERCSWLTTQDVQDDRVLRERRIAYRMLADNSHDWECWVSKQGRILHC
jgi:hypothetical protein